MFKNSENSTTNKKFKSHRLREKVFAMHIPDKELVTKVVFSNSKNINQQSTEEEIRKTINIFLKGSSTQVIEETQIKMKCPISTGHRFQMWCLGSSGSLETLPRGVDAKTTIIIIISYLPLPAHSFSNVEWRFTQGYMTYGITIERMKKQIQESRWASLVAQWLRICLPVQGTRVRALAWEDPTCHGATRPVSHNYWACVSGACAPRQERPRQWEARAPRWRVAPARRN